MPEVFNYVVQGQAALARNAEQFLGIRDGNGNLRRIPVDMGQPHIPEPIPQPDFIHEIDGVQVVIPGWAKYIAQEKTGEVWAFEYEPVKAGKVYSGRGGREKLILNPEEYEMWVKLI